VWENSASIGLDAQKPLRRAYESDEKAVQEWVDDVYPKVRAYAKSKGAEIFWLNEATIRSNDSLQRTWSETGKTPVVTTSGQRQTISVISTLSNKSGFWNYVFDGKFNTDKCIECLKNFQKSRHHPVILLVDGHAVHKSKKVTDYLQTLKGKIEMVFLPPYALDLNTDEQAWNQMRNIGT